MGSDRCIGECLSFCPPPQSHSYGLGFRVGSNLKVLGWVLKLGVSQNWGILGVPIIRTIMFKVSLGSPYFGKLPIGGLGNKVYGLELGEDLL